MSGSTLPEHMTRISLISVVYCSLETPARSAAPYAHQLHAKPSTFGLNLRLALMRSHLLSSIPDSLRPHSSGCRINLLHDLFFGDHHIDLGINFFIGIVLQRNSPCGTLGVAETVSFAEDRIDDDLFALFCLAQLQGAIGTDLDACPAAHALLLIDFADGAGGHDHIMGEERQARPAAP